MGVCGRRCWESDILDRNEDRRAHAAHDWMMRCVCASLLAIRGGAQVGTVPCRREESAIHRWYLILVSKELGNSFKILLDISKIFGAFLASKRK